MKCSKIILCMMISVISNGQFLSRPYRTTNPSQQVPKYAQVGTQKFIAIWGQSNASGNVDISLNPYGINFGDTIRRTKIFDIQTKSWQYLIFGTNQWQDQGNITSAVRYGIESKLMKKLGAYYGGGDNYLIKWTYTGTSLYNNNSLCWNVFVVPISLWNAACDGAQRSNRFLPVQNKQLDWIVWIQGENDAAGGSVQYSVYETNLTDLINWTRTYLGYQVKFLLVKLSTNQTGLNATGLSAVNTAMQNVSVALPGVYIIAPNGTVQTSDHIHYDSAGLSTIASSVYSTIISH